MPRTILIFTGPDYEDLELQYPRLRLMEAGFPVLVAGPEAGASYAGKHGYPSRSDVAFRDVDPKTCSGVVIPGGWLPDRIRRDEVVLRLVRHFHDAGQLVASICHGPSIDISAGVVAGFRYTSSPGIKDDLVNAGAVWEDAPVVIDRHHVSSRRPEDLPAFMQGVLHSLLKK